MASAKQRSAARKNIKQAQQAAKRKARKEFLSRSLPLQTKGTYRSAVGILDNKKPTAFVFGPSVHVGTGCSKHVEPLPRIEPCT